MTDLSEKPAYLVPTLCDAMPIREELQEITCLIMPEDDWRQLEFVSARHAEIVEAELAAIRRVIAEKRSGEGFSEVRLRKGPDRPVAEAQIAFDEIFDEHLPVAFPEGPWGGIVVRSFAVSLPPGLILYGVRSEDRQLEVLGVAVEPSGTSAERADGLSRLALARNLLLVDWVPARSYAPGSPELMARLCGPLPGKT